MEMTSPMLVNGLLIFLLDRSMTEIFYSQNSEDISFSFVACCCQNLMIFSQSAKVKVKLEINENLNSLIIQ